MRHDLALAYGMLRGWRMSLSRISDVWHKRTVTRSPDIRPIRDLQELVHDYSAPFLGARKRRDKRTGHGASSPHQSAARNWNVMSQEDFVLRHVLDAGVKPDFQTALPEHLL